ncbi:hypothetical protein B0T21DRAFT_88022 [Apiosordaria backusii]|uniref:Uncharacterized protein n=1 Tax=Apiosordaria backusii TaxID=314023 RepID=A0AA40ERW7_9PEZI|nr:hypothetical protein B0T21DRAFT_88022 [Apiosordaria backusii]
MRPPDMAGTPRRATPAPPAVPLSNETQPEDARRPLNQLTSRTASHATDTQSQVPSRPVSPSSTAADHNEQPQQTNPPAHKPGSIRKDVEHLEKTSSSIRKLTLSEKLGFWGLIITCTAPIFTLAATAALAFMWLSNASNPAWRSMMVNNWLNTAVAICTEVLKQAMSFQLGITIAMLAALALERGEVLLPYTAFFSIIRATAGAGTTVEVMWSYLLSMWRLRHGKRGSSYRQFVTGVFGLVVLSAGVFAFTQVISVVLFTDVDLAVVPGLTRGVNTSFGFQNPFRRENCEDWELNLGSDSGVEVKCNGEVVDPGVLERLVPRLVDRGGTWTRKAGEYTTFAEYSEPPYEAEGVSDTGVTLRAFLPFQTAQERETLREYSRLTTVLDARVTCQVPEFDDLKLWSGFNGSFYYMLEGSVRASRSTPRLGNVTVTALEGNEFRYNESVPFSCLAPFPFYEPNERINLQPEWQLSICQLGSFSGGLVSEFKDISTWWDQTTGAKGQLSSTYGAAYLFLNVTADGTQKLNSSGDDGVTGWTPRQRNEWFDMVWEPTKGDMILSTTLCYSAFDFADLDVSISSGTNRTEPKTTFNDPARIYNFTNIRKLYGQPNIGATGDGRGILQLEKPQQDSPWVLRGDPASHGEPFMRAYADLGAQSRAKSKYGVPWPFDGRPANVSAMLCETETVLNSGDETYDLENGARIRRVMADLSHVWLVQEILKEGGSIAFALQSMITLLSSMSYYDQMGQFDNYTMSEQAFYVVASIPVKKAGFVVVVAVVLAHLVLAGVVLVAFVNSTSFSRIGETWTVLAQTVVPEGAVTRYVHSSGMQGDDEVEEMMKKDGCENATAGLTNADGRLRIVVAGGDMTNLTHEDGGVGTTVEPQSVTGIRGGRLGNHDYQAIPRD